MSGMAVTPCEWPSLLSFSESSEPLGWGMAQRQRQPDIRGVASGFQVLYFFWEVNETDSAGTWVLYPPGACSDFFPC